MDLSPTAVTHSGKPVGGAGPRRADRVEAATGFHREWASLPGGALSRRYRFAVSSNSSTPHLAWACDLALAPPDRQPSGDAVASVGEGIVACEVAWMDGIAPDVRAMPVIMVDHLLQVCIDRAADLSSLPEACAVGVVVECADDGLARVAIVAVAALSSSRTYDIAGARASRAASGECPTCLEASRPSGDGWSELHRDTCWVVRGAPHADGGVRAHLFPGAHARSLASLTEEERGSLAIAIRSTASWHADHAPGTSWRLRFDQAPCDDDSGDVHLEGRLASTVGLGT